MMVAQMLGTWLERCGEFNVVGRASTSEQGCELCTLHKPDVVLLDINLHGMDGLMLAEWLTHTAPGIKVLVVSEARDAHVFYRVQQLKLPGFVGKTSSLDTLRAAIHAVVQGQCFYTDPFLNRCQEPEASFNLLTRQECEVWRAAVQGHSKEAIASQLKLSVFTVHNHLYTLHLKLGLRSNAELVRFASQSGMAS